MLTPGCTSTEKADLRQILLLAWRLLLRDVAARYRYSVLGLLWTIITPLFLVGLLLMFNRSGIVQIEGSGDLPYPVYAITGVAVWGIFATGLSSASESLANAGSAILRINFPRISLVLAAAGMGLIEFVVRLPVVIGVWFWYGGGASLGGYLLGIVSLLPLVILTLAVGMVLAICGVLLRDVKHLLPIALTLLMLLSPVLYAIPEGSLLGRINAVNPINHFLVTSRGLFVGRPLVPLGYWISTLAAVVLLALAWRFFQVAQAKILERL